MYHPKVIAESVLRLENHAHISLREYTWAQVEEWKARLDTAWDHDTQQQVRALDDEELAFVQNERLMGMAGFRYWAERYATISSQGAGLTPLRLWESQELILARIAAVELDNRQYGQLSDGVLVNILKARQNAGASTLSQAMVAHRVTTQPDIFALVAGDVPAQSGYVMDMLLRVLDNLPWWLRPATKTRVETYPQELEFITGAHVWTASGDSTRGENAGEKGGSKKGNIGRGRTPSVLTLTELSTWAHPEQIDGSLMPGVPIHPRTLAIFESTAKGMGNWWHLHWEASKAGIGRFTPIFIPWYAEKRKHRRPAPASWGPSDETLVHARRCEEHSAYWMGYKVTLTRDQLFWYEQTRQEFELKDHLYEFFEEYPASDKEAFQVAGTPIFTAAVMEQLETAASPIVAVLEVVPRKEIALETAEEQGRPLFELPAGYGFRWVKDIPSVEDLEALMDVLLVWEQPRKKQRYVIGVDVSSGVGKDRATIEVLRMPTLEEPAEQVAEFVSRWVKTDTLARIVDAVGHLFGGADGEALVAVECNNMGIDVQGELQRHLGYTNFYIWEWLDKRKASQRLSNSFGFYTNAKTRPLILNRFVNDVRTIDKVTGCADLVVNSPHLFQEMRAFLPPPGGALWDAQAAPGSHDDCIMGTAIADFCGHNQLFELGEPLSDQRRRLHEEFAERERLKKEAEPKKRDYINSPVSAAYVDSGGTIQDDYGATIYEPLRTW